MTGFRQSIDEIFLERYGVFEDDDVEINLRTLGYLSLIVNIVLLAGVIFIVYNYFISLMLYSSNPSSNNFSLLIYFTGSSVGLGLVYSFFYYSNRFYLNARIYFNFIKLILGKEVSPLYLSIKTKEDYNPSRIIALKQSVNIVPVKINGVDFAQIKPEINTDSTLGYPIFDQINVSKPIGINIYRYKEFEFEIYKSGENISGVPFRLEIILKNETKKSQIIEKRDNTVFSRIPPFYTIQSFSALLFFIFLLISLWIIQIM